MTVRGAPASENAEWGRDRRNYLRGMSEADQRKEKKRATLANQRSRADAQEVRQAASQQTQAQRSPAEICESTC
jgi:hypothetical protein